MYIVDYLKEDREWESYIAAKSEATHYHLLKWREIISCSFGHEPAYLITKENNIVKGVLPLFSMKSAIFGKFLVSLPFLNYGGICADNIGAAQSLLAKAIEIAKKQDSQYIELRHAEEIGLDLQVKKNKVSMILNLPVDAGVLWKKFDAKLRNQIRKAEKSGLVLQAGGLGQLDNFYAVFSRNMRDLGTPVYSKTFFKNILTEYPEDAKIFSVMLKNEVVAAGFTIKFRDTLEIPWASSIRKYNKLSANTFLYWSIIKFACMNNLKYFDFGRCSLNSNTFAFKKQWGAQPRQLNWYYWLNNGNALPELKPTNPKYKLFIGVWKRIPVFLANRIGPRIIKYIP